MKTFNNYINSQQINEGFLSWLGGLIKSIFSEDDKDITEKTKEYTGDIFSLFKDKKLFKDDSDKISDETKNLLQEKDAKKLVESADKFIEESIKNKILTEESGALWELTVLSCAARIFKDRKNEDGLKIIVDRFKEIEKKYPEQAKIATEKIKEIEDKHKNDKPEDKNDEKNEPNDEITPEVKQEFNSNYGEKIKEIEKITEISFKDVWGQITSMLTPKNESIDYNIKYIISENKAKTFLNNFLNKFNDDSEKAKIIAILSIFGMCAKKLNNIGLKNGELSSITNELSK